MLGTTPDPCEHFANGTGTRARGSDRVGRAILIAHRRDCERAWCMGAKYLPTIKDLKAMQRFQQKQNPLKKFNKTPDGQPVKKGKKK